MVTPSTILDISDINKLMSKYEKRDCNDLVRSTILSKSAYWFNKKETAILYVPEDNGRYQVHIYNNESGDHLLSEWCKETGAWLFDNTNASVVINYVKKDRMDLRFFMVSIGSKKRCIVGEDILYTFDRDAYNKLSRSII